MCTSATALLIDLSNSPEAKTFMCTRTSHYVLLPGGKNSPKMYHVKDAQYFSYISNLFIFVQKTRETVCNYTAKNTITIFRQH